MELNVNVLVCFIFIVLLLIIRISSCIETDYENDEDDEIIIENDRTPELSDSESESSI